MERTDLVVTNFNRNFTGVSATTAAVVRQQKSQLAMKLVGQALPGCPQPISKQQAVRLARMGPTNQPFQIWHVRRNSEMQAALYVRDILRLPIRIVFTSAAQRRHSAWPRFLIGRMDAVIATTEAAAGYVGNVHGVVPHGVDTGTFHPAEDRAACWQDTGFPGDRGIACIGRIRPEKGTDLFVKSAIQALPNLPGVSALIIGKAKSEHQSFLKILKSRVAETGLADRIIFTDEVQAEHLPQLVRSLSLLVALPRYEGFGLTPLEAMASAVPIIASDTGHFREFVGQDQAGFVLDKNDPTEAAEKIQLVLNDPELAAKLSQNATNLAKDHFNIKKEVAGIFEVYRGLWQRGP